MRNRLGSQRITSIGQVPVSDASPSELANALRQVGHPCGGVLLPSYYQFVSNMEMATKALLERGIQEVPRAPQPPQLEGDNHGEEKEEGDEG